MELRERYAEYEEQDCEGEATRKMVHLSQGERSLEGYLDTTRDFERYIPQSLMKQKNNGVVKGLKDPA